MPPVIPKSVWEAEKSITGNWNTAKSKVSLDTDWSVIVNETILSIEIAECDGGMITLVVVLLLNNQPMTDIIEIDPSRKKDKKREAKSLYWRGWSVNQISDDLDVPVPTIHSWKSRDKWDDTPMIERIESNLDYRLSALILKEKKEGRDFKEIDLTYAPDRIHRPRA